MLLAAASMMAAYRSSAAHAIPLLEQALKDATSDADKTYIRLALANAYTERDDFAHELPLVEQLHRDYPESLTAFGMHFWALLGQHQYDQALALCDERLKLLDDDTDAQLNRVRGIATHGDFAKAHDLALGMVDRGKVSGWALNNLGWYALFSGKLSDKDFELAIKATQMEPNETSIDHTLACMYAERGRTKEAYDIVVHDLDQLNLSEPSEIYWYVLGRIAEQYGERATAIDDYRHLKKPIRLLGEEDSTWELAQRRLRVLGADSATK
jgi:tetratricopeptide (TPR) repeat protein